jgi:hypothetical protein
VLQNICSGGTYFTENLFCRNFLNEKLVPGTFSTVLKMCHNSSGQQCVNKTVTKINERYYWKGIVENTRKVVKQCEICQRQNKKAKTAVPELNYASIGQRIWGKIGIGLIGPFLIERKNKFHCWS